MTNVEFIDANKRLARWVVENATTEHLLNGRYPALNDMTYAQICWALQQIDGPREARLIERMERSGGPAAYRESHQSGNTSFPDTDPSDNFDA